jgi:long-chain acyl-CoA synthetase
MLKSGVENVYPAEVENAVSSHPKVAECAVIGTPDPKFIQVVKAVVVLRDGEEASPDEIIDHCRSLIAGYKRPRHVVFVDQLPRDGFAVDYAALDATFDGGGYPGVGTRSS